MHKQSRFHNWQDGHCHNSPLRRPVRRQEESIVYGSVYEGNLNLLGRSQTNTK